MKTATILSGNFATGEGQLGNFTAYPEDGAKIFIHKKLMENAGYKTDKDIKYPFFALITEREIDTRDENGELTGTMVKRVQATAVFTKIEDLVQAKNSSKKIEILCAQDLAKIATEAGLTEKQLDLIMGASI